MIKVAINGYCGRMGKQIVAACAAASDIEIVAGIDRVYNGEHIELNGQKIAPTFTDLETAIIASQPQVLIDFTAPASIEGNLRTALPHAIDCVVGTTGLSLDKYSELIKLAPNGTTLFHAPNFTIGAVLMMEFSKKAAAFFADAEVIEFHHNGKLDAPSGTALKTAQDIAAVRASANIKTTSPGKETELEGLSGARGSSVDGVSVHSVRSNGFVAHQEVIFGGSGETLTIRHDSIDRAAYMPGVLLAVRKVGQLSGLIIGLEKLMDI